MSDEYERNYDAIVVQYFCGQLADSTRLAFETWLQEDLSRTARTERLRAVWELSARTVVGPDAEAALVEFKGRLTVRRTSADATQHVLRLEPSSVARRSRTGAMGRVAAAIVGLAATGLLWQTMLAPTALPARSYTTSRGERALVNLPDGSTVTLHTESTLEVPRDFGVGMRDVRLRGEGYFEVTPDSSRPFRVHGGDAVARVLGTKFGVRARSEEPAIVVAVLDGRVAVGFDSATAASVLTAGQVARLRVGNAAIERDVDVRQLLSWTSGRLMFDKAPVLEVLAELSRWFDRDFVLSDSALAGTMLTTSLGGQSLAEAIAVLETALGVRATVELHRIVLSPS